MIQGKFCGLKGSKTVGFSHSDFGFVVQALDHAAGELLASPEIVQQQLAVVAQGAGVVWAMLDMQLATIPFVAGQELTVGDIALGNAVHRWFKFPIDRPDLPSHASMVRPFMCKASLPEAYCELVMCPLIQSLPNLAEVCLLFSLPLS